MCIWGGGQGLMPPPPEPSGLALNSVLPPAPINFLIILIEICKTSLGAHETTGRVSSPVCRSKSSSGSKQVKKHTFKEKIVYSLSCEINICLVYLFSRILLFFSSVIKDVTLRKGSLVCAHATPRRAAKKFVYVIGGKQNNP